MVRTRKDLKLATKATLFVANAFQDYADVMIFSESCYTLFIHLFGKAHALKTFGTLKRVKTISELKATLREVELKLKKTVIPRTRYQKMYQAIKERALTSIQNTLDNLVGIQGNPHEKRRMRNQLRRTSLGEYYVSRQKKGLNYQV